MNVYAGIFTVLVVAFAIGSSLGWIAWITWQRIKAFLLNKRKKNP
jgi:citrate synthase